MPSKPRLSVNLRDIGLWALLGILVVVQLAALWMVCLGQVRKAEARHQSQLVEQRAVEECVRRNSRSSLISCADQAADQQSAAVAAARKPAFVGTTR